MPLAGFEPATGAEQTEVLAGRLTRKRLAISSPGSPWWVKQKQRTACALTAACSAGRSGSGRPHEDGPAPPAGEGQPVGVRHPLVFWDAVPREARSSRRQTARRSSGAPIRPRLRSENRSVGASGCDTNQVLDLIGGDAELRRQLSDRPGASGRRSSSEAAHGAIIHPYWGPAAHAGSNWDRPALRPSGGRSGQCAATTSKAGG